MRPDPGLALQEAVIASMDLPARSAVRLRLRERAWLLAWQQADGSGHRDPLALAEFLLRRLHPEMPETSLAQVLHQLGEALVAGEWQGFRRPEVRDRLSGR